VVIIVPLTTAGGSEKVARLCALQQREEPQKRWYHQTTQDGYPAKAVASSLKHAVSGHFRRDVNTLKTENVPTKNIYISGCGLSLCSLPLPSSEMPSSTSSTTGKAKGMASLNG
jgi:hypothetical protein